MADSGRPCCAAPSDAQNHALERAQYANIELNAAPDPPYLQLPSHPARQSPSGGRACGAGELAAVVVAYVGFAVPLPSNKERSVRLMYS